jgi:acetaldehyde dehydrogenase (acetylating)
MVDARSSAEGASLGMIHRSSLRERIVSIAQNRWGMSYHLGEGARNNAATVKDSAEVRRACDLVEAAHFAQAELERLDQEKIDSICEAMVRAALREAGRLEAMEVEESGYGVPADKEEKNRLAAEDVWARFRDLRTVGVISESEYFLEIATPRGVVAGIVPPSSPTSTAIFMALISIKSRNALVLSPHHSVARCTNETVRVLRDAAIEEGLPADAIGCMTRVTSEGTKALIRHERTAMILATEDHGLVRLTFSSGEPVFGFGSGTVSMYYISPLDLMDIERVAFKPQPVEGTRPSGTRWELQRAA